MDAFPFTVETRKIDSDIGLLYFDVEDVLNVAPYLDSHIVPIFCGPQAEMDVGFVKRCLANQLKPKLKRDFLLCGAVAEFFVHLLLNHRGYRQNFLYQNLEERSAKKGFDGVYSIGDELWLMESKSGCFNGNQTHYEKVTEATNDLKNKVSGQGGANNPWKNAYNHASHCDVGASSTLRSQIIELEMLYESGTYQNISSFNIIPCATLFYTNAIEREDLDELASKIGVYFSKRSHTGVDVVCVSNSALYDFLSYLGLRRSNGQ